MIRVFLPSASVLLGFVILMLAAGSTIGAAAAADGDQWTDVESNLSAVDENVMENATADQYMQPHLAREFRDHTVHAVTEVGVSTAIVGAKYGYEWPWIGQYLSLPMAVVGWVLPLAYHFQKIRRIL